MGLFKWMRSLWHGSGDKKENHQQEFYLTFLCDQNLEKREMIKEKFQGKDEFKKQCHARTRKRGIEKNRTKLDVSYDFLIKKFINARLMFDKSVWAYSEDIYMEYLNWCLENYHKPQHRQGFFRAFNFFCKNKHIYRTSKKEKNKPKKSYNGVSLKRCYFEMPNVLTF